MPGWRLVIGLRAQGAALGLLGLVAQGCFVDDNRDRGGRCYDATDCPYGSRCTQSRFCSAAPDIVRPGGHHEAGVDGAGASDGSVSDAPGDGDAAQSVEDATSDAPAEALSAQDFDGDAPSAFDSGDAPSE